MNAADTAWLLVSSALVMLMTPGLALFYAGMIRRKNVISTTMMSFAMLGVASVLWLLYGYSLSFGSDIGGIFGGLDFALLRGVGQTPSDTYASTVPHLAFFAFQGMFAIITLALITGAVVERMRFAALMVFSVIWLTVVYCPVAHWVWGAGGWLLNLGALDFAGGTVVHICAGFSALALAMILGPRKGYAEGRPMEAHNIPMVVLGAGLLWFGWFGFNAGSALTSGGLASSAFVATNTSAAAAAVTWMLLSWWDRKPSALGVATGAVAGLVAITPAAGFVSPVAAIPIGMVVSVVCYFCIRLRVRMKIDESLDVWAVHGMGGVWGAFATGIFADPSVGGATGLIFGNASQVGLQAVGIVVVAVFAFGMTYLIGRLLSATIGLRVQPREETLGLDLAQHAERAYGGSV
ncbi:MAG: ammonium transporter [Dehalococcoidia bacterium]|nr:ammonium transporter [Dehalococcoidia bacterium]